MQSIYWDKIVRLFFFLSSSPFFKIFNTQLIIAFNNGKRMSDLQLHHYDHGKKNIVQLLLSRGKAVAYSFLHAVIVK